MNLTCRWCGHKSSEDAMELVDITDYEEDNESAGDEEPKLLCNRPDCGRMVQMRVYVSDNWMCFACAADHFAMHNAIFTSLTI